MAKLINRIGQVFGRLIVISRADNDRLGHTQWICRCECGTEKILPTSVLTSGDVRSCGCLRSEITRKRSTKHGYATRDRHTPTYQAWNSMIKRCINQNCHSFKDYGGRGITVCDRWLNSFPNFLADMGEKPRGMTIGRIKNHLGYSPDNCRWETSEQQANNKRNNRMLTLDGITLTVAQWAEKLGINKRTLSNRFHHGWSDYDALTTPARKLQRKIQTADHTGSPDTTSE